MRALTIRQPWAQLIALGIKWIETRSWATKYQGPVLIHAGKHKPRTEWFRDNGPPMPPWFDLYAMAGCYRWLEDERDGWWDLGGYEWVGPLGCVVAVADLVDCVPICGADERVPRAWMPHIAEVRGEGPQAGQLWWWKGSDGGYAPTSRWITQDVSDQRPFGDFTPGRHAWLLDNVRPLSTPVPAKGRQGLWKPDDALIDAVRAASATEAEE